MPLYFPTVVFGSVVYISENSTIFWIFRWLYSKEISVPFQNFGVNGFSARCQCYAACDLLWTLSPRSSIFNNKNVITSWKIDVYQIEGYLFLYIVDLNRKKKYKQTKQIHNHQAETSKKDFSMASTSSTVYLMYFSGFFVNGKLEYLEKKIKEQKFRR